MRENEDTNKWRHKACSLARKFNTVKMSSLPKLISTFNITPIQIPVSFL